MFAVAVVTMAGRLLLFIMLLTLPPPARPARGEPGQAGRGAEPPAVISLLAGPLIEVVALAGLAGGCCGRAGGGSSRGSPSSTAR
jgi:hypothetical protein